LFIGPLEKHPRFSRHCYTNPSNGRFGSWRTSAKVSTVNVSIRSFHAHRSECPRTRPDVRRTWHMSLVSCAVPGAEKGDSELMRGVLASDKSWCRATPLRAWG